MKATSKDMNRHWLSKFSVMVQALLIANLLLPSTAFAYVDPGSGSVIVTTILGLIAAIGYTFRKYLYKIKRSITGEKPTDEKPQDNQVSEE